jgi:hypothetical protein
MEDGDLTLDDFPAPPPPRASALVHLALFAAPLMWSRDAFRLHLPSETPVAL